LAPHPSRNFPTLLASLRQLAHPRCCWPIASNPTGTPTPGDPASRWPPSRGDRS